jgi:hypothetical protein
MLLFQSKSQSKPLKAASSFIGSQLNDVVPMESSAQSTIPSSSAHNKLGSCISWSEKYKPKILTDLKIHYAKIKFLREWFGAQFAEVSGK